jgi:tuberculosinol/isotuberculosinol synthase
MDIDTFRDLSLAEVAQIVRSSGPRVCVLPVNGTRRWFMLEHPLSPEQDYAAVYCDVASRRHTELCRLFFDHGVNTLLTPIFGPDLLERGEAYARMATEELSRLAMDSVFLDLYRTYQVRVRFYGDYRRFFDSTQYAYLIEQFDTVTAQTSSHDRFRLFYGVCAQDATEAIAGLAVEYHSRHGRVPDKRALVEMYYGEYVGPADLFIGFDRFCVFDMPLLATGNEDLYFTVSPSAYFTERQLREILYDHLIARRGSEPEYADLKPEERSLMKRFYRANVGKTLGVGVQSGPVWYPLPQVELPPGFAQTGMPAE